MIELIQGQFSFIAAITIGLFISVISSKNPSFKITVLRLATGIFFACFLTAPVLNFMEWDGNSYRDGVAGLLAMNGFGIARILTHFSKQDFYDFLSFLRNGRNG